MQHNPVNRKQDRWNQRVMPRGVIRTAEVNARLAKTGDDGMKKALTSGDRSKSSEDRDLYCMCTVRSPGGERYE